MPPQIPAVSSRDEWCTIARSAPLECTLFVSFNNEGPCFLCVVANYTAFISASANADKGCFAGEYGLGEARRCSTDQQESANSPAHVPFFKRIAGDVMNPLTLSAKGIWCFENVNRTVAATVKVFAHSSFRGICWFSCRFLLLVPVLSTAPLPISLKYPKDFLIFDDCLCSFVNL